MSAADLIKKLLQAWAQPKNVELPPPPKAPTPIAPTPETDFRALAENSRDVILRVGPDFVHSYASPSARDLFGREPAELIGRPAKDFIFGEDLPVIAANAKRLYSGEIDNVVIRVRVVRKDSSLVWAEVSPKLLRDPKTGTPNGDVVLILRDITERKRLEDQLAAMALSDAMTGLANRRAFDEALHREWKRTLREGGQMSLVLFDLDHFKQFNDRYGHHVGDDCLRAVAAALRRVASRPGDFPARYGGEEMVLILPQTDAEGGAAVGETVRAAVEALALPHEGNPQGGAKVTASVGVATAFARAGGSVAMPEGLVLAADAAMYRAKDKGRNRVETTVLIAPDQSARVA